MLEKKKRRFTREEIALMSDGEYAAALASMGIFRHPAPINPNRKPKVTFETFVIDTRQGTTR